MFAYDDHINDQKIKQTDNFPYLITFETVEKNINHWIQDVLAAKRKMSPGMFANHHLLHQIKIMVY